MLDWSLRDDKLDPTLYTGLEYRVPLCALLAPERLPPHHQLGSELEAVLEVA